MQAASSTCAGIRYLVASLLIGLSLVLATSGCARSDNESGKKPPPDTPSPEKVVETPPTPLPNETPAETPQVSRRKAVFMGSHAVGERFCIIADASASMRGEPFVQLKDEILQTLEGLDPASQFYVIFFNNVNAKPMPSDSWLTAGKENVDKVRPWVKNMTLAQKTLPQAAFKRAFELKPKPDVIFFMTDGALQGKNPDPVSQINTLNAAEPKVAIHTIMFTSERVAAAKSAIGVTQLRTIAEKNGGTFRHVNHKQVAP